MKTNTRKKTPLTNYEHPHGTEVNLLQWRGFIFLVHNSTGSCVHPLPLILCVKCVSVFQKAEGRSIFPPCLLRQAQFPARLDRGRDHPREGTATNRAPEAIPKYFAVLRKPIRQLELYFLPTSTASAAALASLQHIQNLIAHVSKPHYRVPGIVDRSLLCSATWNTSQQGPCIGNGNMASNNVPQMHNLTTLIKRYCHLFSILLQPFPSQTSRHNQKSQSWTTKWSRPFLASN